MARILLVEDEVIVREDILWTLERAGHKIVGATGYGEEAVELALRERPDLVVMDVRLQGKMDGADAATEIAKHHKCAVLFLTAYSTAVFQDREGLPPKRNVLRKPASTEKTLAAVAELLEESPPG
jgi:CheY-like chemotaxis protein